jgi:hypothetical protein
MPQQERLWEDEEVRSLLRGSAQALHNGLASTGCIVGDGRALNGSDPDGHIPISARQYDEGRFHAVCRAI